jgi:flavodoxin
MRSVVVYESMFGNTHLIAQAIASEFGPPEEVFVVPADEASAPLVEGARLLVVGGPTHAHSMSRASTRQAAIDAARKSPGDLDLDPAATGLGLRDWLGSLGEFTGKAAAFDTRVNGVALFTGHASKAISRELTRHGFDLAAPPESFRVDRNNHLVGGEVERANSWGRALARAMTVSGLSA